MSQQDNEIENLKELVVTMASHAENSVHQALKALLRRDDDLARVTREEDTRIDLLEVDIDSAVHEYLASKPLPWPVLRRATTAMKIAHDLERVGDEATTIARRAILLGQDSQLEQVESIPPMAQIALDQLKESIDCFVAGEPERARALIPRDKELDRLNKQLVAQLIDHMSLHPKTVSRILHLMVISKSLERIGDHATNIAEMVVYMCEGRDIRHSSKSTPRA